MIFSDKTIIHSLEQGRIVIVPWPQSEDIQPSSVDLHLYNQFQKLNGNKFTSASYNLLPGQFILGCTDEWIELGDDVVGKIEGKSSIGRKGVVIELAGYVDPGWKGRLTLELYNASDQVYVLHAGQKICQIRFMSMTTPVLREYGHPNLNSHYQMSAGTEGAKE